MNRIAAEVHELCVAKMKIVEHGSYETDLTSLDEEYKFALRNEPLKSSLFKGHPKAFNIERNQDVRTRAINCRNDW